MEATTEQKLKSLFNLQLVDTKIDKIRSIRGELPMEVADLEDEIIGLNTRIDKLTTETTNLKNSVEDAKNSIKNSNALIKRYEEQQNDVKNNREYLALTKEIDLQKLEIMVSEKKIKEYQNTQTEKKEALEKAKVLLEERKTELVTKKEELSTITAETQKEEEHLTAVRNKAIEIVDTRLLNAYERVRKNVINQLAVVSIERDACAGCFSKVPPQKQLDVKQRKKIIVCENCGRVLVDVVLAEEVREEMLKEFGSLV